MGINMAEKDSRSLSVALVFVAGALCEYHTGSGLGWAFVVILFCF